MKHRAMQSTRPAPSWRWGVGVSARMTFAVALVTLGLMAPAATASAGTGSIDSEQTLRAAFSAGGSYTLTQSFTVVGGNALTVESGTNLTLDLDGKTLTIEGAAGPSGDATQLDGMGGVPGLDNRGTLTVQNGTLRVTGGAGGQGAVDADSVMGGMGGNGGPGAAAVTNSGTLVLSGVTNATIVGGVGGDGAAGMPGSNGASAPGVVESGGGGSGGGNAGQGGLGIDNGGTLVLSGSGTTVTGGAGGTGGDGGAGGDGSDATINGDGGDGGRGGVGGNGGNGNVAVNNGGVRLMSSSTATLQVGAGGTAGQGGKGGDGGTAGTASGQAGVSGDDGAAGAAGRAPDAGQVISGNSGTVALDGNGAVAPEQVTANAATLGDTIGALADLPTSWPTRDGYTLDRWNTGIDGTGTDVDTHTSTAVSGQRIYAQWTSDAPTCDAASFQQAFNGAADQHTVTLGCDVTITAADNLPLTVPAGTSITLDLSGHTLNVTAPGELPGIAVGTAQLTIEDTSTTGSGILKATGAGNSGSGIAVNTPGRVTITGGTVTATGSIFAAGIGGGGGGGTAGSVVITGGTVTATGGAQAAGIGGNSGGNGGDVSISGGTVTASSTGTGAGIGGGSNGDAGRVSISGGTVTASSPFGSGIGSGGQGAGSPAPAPGLVSIGAAADVTISGNPNTGAAIGSSSALGQVSSAGILTLPDEATLDLKGGTLTNTGTIDNHGSIKDTGSGGTLAGTGTVDNSGAIWHTVTVGSNQTVKNHHYQLSFDPRSGEIDWAASQTAWSILDGPTLKSVGRSTDDLPTATRTGYAFDGWNTEADGTGNTVADDTVLSTDSSTGSAVTVTLYAKWLSTTATLHAYPNGGADQPTSCPVVTELANGCTLEQALGLANSGDSVMLEADPGDTDATFTTDAGWSVTQDSLTIEPADGVHATLDGQQHAPIVLDYTGTGALSVSDLTVKGSVGSTNLSTPGGGIVNVHDGTLDVTDSTFESNGSAQGYGGGIVNWGLGKVSVAGSTFSDDPAHPVRGNGIQNVSDGPVTVTDSTFAASGTTTPYGSIDARGPGSVTVIASTFFGTGAAGNGTIHIAIGHVRIAGSVLATGGSSCDISPQYNSVVVDGGYNISDDDSCGLDTASHSVSGSTRLVATLNSLGDNGGPTETVAPMPDSPAVGMIPASTTVTVGSSSVTLCPTTDQRGTPSAAGETCNAGSVQGTANPPCSPITFAAAFNSAPDGGTVTLNCDVTIGAGDNLPLAVTTNKAITLDLNGHTLKVTAPDGKAGIEVATIVESIVASLTIEDSSSPSTGKLEATGGQYGAGIGGDTVHAAGGNVTITGGTVIATGGSGGASAGIGGGAVAAPDGLTDGEGGTVTISGGTVTATGNGWGAGIGGTDSAGGGTASITGGTVTAIGGENGAGIGSAYGGLGVDLTIGSAADVTVAGADSIAIGGGRELGTVTTSGALRLPAEESIDLSDGTLTNNGTLTNAGSISGPGTLDGTGTIDNSGAITHTVTVGGDQAVTDHHYKLSFDAGDGSVDWAGATPWSIVDGPTLTSVGRTTADFPQATRAGYTLTGWNTKADGGGTAISDTATLSTDSSDGTAVPVTLFAQWRSTAPVTLYAYPHGGASSPAACDKAADLAGACTLGQALGLAASDDTVVLEADPGAGSTARFTTTTGWEVPQRSLKVKPGNGVTATLDGQGQAAYLLHYTGSGTLTVSDLTITGTIGGLESAAPGGGIVSDSGGSITVADGTFTDNTIGTVPHDTSSSSTTVGGGIVAMAPTGGGDAGSVTVTGSHFTDNTGSASQIAAWGGGILSYGPVHVTDSTFTGNSVTADVSFSVGGGIIALDGATVSGSTFTDNTTAGAVDAVAFGGGIVTLGGGASGPAAVVSTSTFTGNTTVGPDNPASGEQANGVTYGGGVVAAFGGGETMQVTASTFAHNDTTGGDATSGGGMVNTSIFGQGSGQATVSTSTFVDNAGPASNAGGIFSSGPVIVTASTFVEGTGVGITSTAPVRLVSSVLAGDGTGCVVQGETGTIYDGGFNIASDDSCGFAQSSSVASSAGLASLLNPLGDNGGPTETVAPMPGSPAVGMIPVGATPEAPGSTGTLCPATDQRGTASADGEACNAGAVQGSAPGVPACASDPFTDVPSTDPNCPYINWMVGRGITSGYPDRTYRPDYSVTRQTMAAFLYRLDHHGDQAPACDAAPFTDVPTSNPFCGAIAWLDEQGIAHGYGDGEFHPSQPVTMQTLAAFLYRLDHDGADAPPCTSAPYADVPKDSEFCGAIAWASDESILTGTDDHYQPLLVVTRGSVAPVLFRYDTVTTGA